MRLFGIVHPWFMGHDDETLCRWPNRELGFSCSKPSDNRKSTIAAIDHHIPVPTARWFRSEKYYFDFQRCLKVHPSGNSGYTPERRSDGALLDHVGELRQRRHPRPRRWALPLTRRRLTRDDAFRCMSQHSGMSRLALHVIQCDAAICPVLGVNRKCSPHV